MNRKITRLFRDSFKFYCINFSRNLFMSISISVSLAIFLFVAVFLDCSFANEKKSVSRVQDNYVDVMVFSQETEEIIKNLLSSYNVYTVKHCSAVSNIDDGKKVVQVKFNCLGAENYWADLSIYSYLDTFGSIDASNCYSYERFELLGGTNTFTANNQVIISEEFAGLLEKNPLDCLGKQLSIAINGPSEVYTVTGIYKSLLTDARNNRETFKQLNGEQENLELYYSIIVPPANMQFSVRTNLYFFFSDDEEYEKIITSLRDFKKNSSDFDHPFNVTDNHTLQEELQRSFAQNNMVKGLLMAIIAVITGIGTFGTIKNNMADRKKELGIKRAVGATDFDILFTVVVENCFNSVVSMFLAFSLVSLILLPYGIFQRKVRLMDYIIYISPATVWLFIFFAFSIVLGFSMIPAYNATQVNVIDAIREEN